MKHHEQLAKNIRDLYFGPSSVGSTLKDSLEGVDMKMATTQVHGLNTIAKLVYHINYYIRAVTKVLEGGPLDAHDKFSYDLPPINTEADWQALLENTWAEAHRYADRIDELSEEKLHDTMADEKYGNWFRNLTIINEHTNYHLGQIVLIKKMISSN